VIITCDNCNKKFDVNSSLIPDKGRLLQCIGCDHKWFFKKEIINKPIVANIHTHEVKKDKVQSEIISKDSLVDTKLLDSQIKENFLTEKKSINEENIDNKINQDITIETSEHKKNPNILGLTIVFIISFIAVIIVLDTFQAPISKIVPNLEFILYNLYQTINDILLFSKDLI